MSVVGGGRVGSRVGQAVVKQGSKEASHLCVVLSSRTY
jgi:hypothetical protein